MEEGKIMKAMDKDTLMDRLARYGYVLMRPNPAEQPEKLLLSLLKQNDVRLLEGVPVVLAHLLQKKEALQWESKAWRPEDELSKKVEHRWAIMLVLSFFLFELFGLEKKYGLRLLKLLYRCKGGKELLAKMGPSFPKSTPVKMDEVELSIERLKNNFRNYVVHAPESEETQKKKHALELDLLLSEVFTARQKELLKKRMQGKPMTKTEKEYFYRVVKKRLKTLANEELHQMARALLQK